MTFKAFFYFVPCYFDNETNDLWGRNFVFDLALDIMISFHSIITFGASYIASIIGNEEYEPTFPIKLKGKA